MKNTRITVRLEETDREKIEQLIQKGHFKNMSRFLRQAVRRLLDECV